MALVLVQEIISKWDKSVRGGKAARQRSALPEAIRIPSITPIPYATALVHDEVHFYKGTHHQVMIDELAAQQKIYRGCVSIVLDATVVSVTFTYNRTCGGAPERTAFPRKVLTLSLGTWGRVIYHGRFSNQEGGQWQYQKTVLNIGYFATLKNNIFLATPDQTFAEMVDLW